MDLALCLMAALAVSVRYESLFLAASVTLLLIFQRRWALAAAVVAFAWAPAVAYGAYSLSKGSMFFPNSVALKGQMGQLNSVVGVYKAFIDKWFHSRLMLRSSHIFALATLAGALFLSRGREAFKKPGLAGYMALLFVPAALMHLEFSTVGNFFRYEMYLVPVGLLIGALYFFGRAGGEAQNGMWKMALAALTLVSAVTLGWRGAVAHARVPGAVGDMYGFHWKITEFIKKNYDGRTLVINDIGMPGFYTDIKMVDIWGLANVETARLSYQGKLNAESIGKMAKEHGACVAIVYPECLGFERLPPPDWKKVGEWTIDDPTVAMSTFQFYAVEPSEFPGMARALKEFDAGLPPWVHHAETTEPSAAAHAGD